MNDRFTLESPAFAGPLDALLDIIETRKMSISDISLATVTDAYLEYIAKLPELPLEETAQFIVIASTLLLIKSRTLLPSLNLTEEESQSVDELEKRLARLRIIRMTAKRLKASWGKQPLIGMRHSPDRAATFAPGTISPMLLFESIHHLINTLPKPEKILQASVAPVLALEDVIKNLHKRLRGAIRESFSNLVGTANRHDVIVHFLAVLELVRAGSASVTQDTLFSDITIEIEELTAPRYGV